MTRYGFNCRTCGYESPPFDTSAARDAAVVQHTATHIPRISEWDEDVT